jgi:hypothetical protein
VLAGYESALLESNRNRVQTAYQLCRETPTLPAGFLQSTQPALWAASAEPGEPSGILVHFNVLFAHLFSVLSGSQLMLAFDINPCKHLTVSALLDSTFPAIESTDNQPAPMITSKTVGYIHALIIDTVTLNNSESLYARTLRNEQMVTQELDKMDPHKFRSESVKCLADYYKNVRDMEGAGGLHCVKSFKRKFKDIAPPTLDSIKASSS